MNVRERTFPILLSACMLTLYSAPAATKKGDDHERNTITGPGLLWRYPTDIASRDLFYGPGGEEHQPRLPLRFEKEDLEGSNPKFTVVDKDQVKWKVKLGQEARPETAATRIAWAVGYFANEDYLLTNFKIEGMPAKLHRGQKYIAADGTIPYARFKREIKDAKKLGIWAWKDQYWSGTRELNGLKVVMALINNWDLKDINNVVYQNGDERIFMVSDMGATFGSPGRSFPRDRAKDNVDEYTKSQFICGMTDDTVDFTAPARPRFVYFVDPKEYLMRVHLESLGRNVPRQDVWWIGQLLGCLSPKQIRDAFRAAGYNQDEVERFAQAMEKRIAQLTDL